MLTVNRVVLVVTQSGGNDCDDTSLLMPRITLQYPIWVTLDKIKDSTSVSRFFAKRVTMPRKPSDSLYATFHAL